jgi:hypothetical protein
MTRESSSLAKQKILEGLQGGGEAMIHSDNYFLDIVVDTPSWPRANPR